MARRTKRSGFTILESVMATLIVAVALMGVGNLFWTAYNLATESTGASVAYNVARDVVEQVHAQGFYNAAEGTKTVYYDRTGANPSSTQGTNRYKVVTVITSDKKVGTSVAEDALRAVTVTVTDLSTNSVVYQTGTNLVRGGL
jgi:Tfp pilus assembly protein PilV